MTTKLTHFLRRLRILPFAQPGSALVGLLSSNVRPLENFREDKRMHNGGEPTVLTGECVSDFGDFMEMLRVW